MYEIPNLQKNLLKTSSAKDAKDYFLTEGYLGENFTLPQYYKAVNLQEIKLEKLDWDKRKTIKVTYPICLTQPKGKYGVRQFDIVHPYAYIHLVNFLTDKVIWERIVNNLTSESLVESYSLPCANSAFKGVERLAYRKFSSVDLTSELMEFQVLAKSDISNFYKSIYTHSLSWVIHGKSLAKKNRGNFSLIGNKMDKLLQNTMSGQTNGLPIGTKISELISELLLKEVDKKLSIHLKKLGIKALRYRDDYRFLCKTETDARKILMELGKLLNDEFNLTINDEKSLIFKNPFDAFKLIHMNNPVIHSFLEFTKIGSTIESRRLTELLYNIRTCENLDKKAVKTIISLLAGTDDNKIIIKTDADDLPEQISLLKSLIDSYGELLPQIFALIDRMLTELKDKNLGDQTVGKLYKYTQFSLNSIGEIWLHRLANRWSEKIKNEIEINTMNPLIKVVSNSDIPHYTLFEDVNFSENDKKELEKFRLFVDDTFLESKEKELTEEPQLWFDYD